MSNPFKSNRVSDNYNSYNSFNSFRGGRNSYVMCEAEKQRIREENEAKERRRIAENERKHMEAIQANNFPELSSENTQQTTTNKISYLSIFNECKQEDELDKPITVNELIKPGWTFLEKDKSTGATIISHKIIPSIKAPKSEKTLMMEKADKMIQSLNETYERRKKLFIEINGEDVWEDMFRHPNYDYEYYNFDGLDYEEESESEESDYENEYENSYESKKFDYC